MNNQTCFLKNTDTADTIKLIVAFLKKWWLILSPHIYRLFKPYVLKNLKIMLPTYLFWKFYGTTI